MSANKDLNLRLYGFFAPIIGPLIATGLLFVLLPLLTQVSRPKTEIKEQTQIMIFQHKTQKMPEVKKRQEETKPREIKTQKTVEQKTQRPEFDVLAGGAAGAGIAGTVSIGMVEKGSLVGAGKDLFKVDSSLYATAFELNEVDQRPQVIRRVDPIYPFLARRNNIEGKVALRFIVDSEGNILEPEVTFSKPEGVFDEAAIECILKWKIRPAERNGKPVDCIVNQYIGFTTR